jgi:arylsulfatase A-like enzyme
MSEPSSDSESTVEARPRRRAVAVRTVALTAAGAAFIVLMEWLFQVTKHSFLDVFRVHERIAAVVFGSALASVPPSAFALALLVVSWWTAGTRRIGLLAASLVPATLWTTAVLLALENFTYTLFGLGLVTVGRLGRVVYILFLGLALVLIWRRCHAFIRRPVTGRDKVAVALPLLGTGLAVWAWATLPRHDLPSVAGRDAGRLPNVVLIAADGIDADLTQAYGFHRPNTPFLVELLGESLRMKYAVANSRSTAGSTTSLLTGRFASTTKVMYPPQKLMGIDAYRHLPAVLQELGYRSIQTSARYYAGATDLNMKDSFHLSNGVPEATGRIPVPKAVTVAFPSCGMLLDDIRQKVDDRLAHLTGNRELVDARSISDDQWVVRGKERVSDPARIEAVLDFFEQAEGAPVFAHIHLLETHCCQYRPRVRRFSQNRRHRTGRSRDHWDDAVADSDDRLRDLVEGLKRLGEWDNTVLVYSSDHTRAWTVDHYVPLVIRLPDRRTGDVGTLAQLVDVAPTVVDYLGVEIPVWMEGHSLLSPRAPEEVLSISAAKYDVKKVKDFQVGTGYPLYGMKALQIGRCNEWVRINLETGQFMPGQFQETPWQCDGSLDPGTALTTAYEHLSSRGFGGLENLASAARAASSEAASR